MFNNFFRKIGAPKGDNRDDESLPYESIPLTLALRKRRFDEEQRKKYNIEKPKKCDFWD